MRTSHSGLAVGAAQESLASASSNKASASRLSTWSRLSLASYLVASQPLMTTSVVAGSQTVVHNPHTLDYVPYLVNGKN